MGDRILVIDVETANYRFDSICQIGAALIENGEITQEWETLVNPQQHFEDFHSDLHGITPQAVKNAPIFKDALSKLLYLASDSVIASYGHFDRSAVSQACDRASLPPPPNAWLNLHQVVKRAWPEKFGGGGFRLNMVTKFLGIKLQNHHNALDDARAAAHILIHASQEKGATAEAWLKAVRRPINYAFKTDLPPEVNTNGHLYGENMAFTGSLNIPRKEAQRIAAALGCTPQNGVTKKTTILVVGEQDLTKIKGDKSAKHTKAEELIEKGAPIRIIGEQDFAAMAAIEAK